MTIRDESLGSDKAFKEWMADLSHLEHTQLPFALSLAINDSMFSARKPVLKQYSQDLDGGLNYFRKDLKIEKSHKKQPVIEAAIGEKTGYMAMQQFGHTKSSPNGGQMAIPTERAYRRYGTKQGKMKRSGWPSRLLRGYKGPIASGKRGGRGHLSARDRGVFPIKTKDGRKMIVSREGHASRIGGTYYEHEYFVVLYVYADRAAVPKNFDMSKPVLEQVRRVFPKKLTRHMQRALKTARR